MNRSKLSVLTYLDVVTLKRIQEAEDQNAAIPPAFVDTLVRLSKVGCIQSNHDRSIRITTIGRRYLQNDA